MIKLTDDYGNKLYVNEQLIETILTTRGNQAEIILTTGKHIVVSESPDYINVILNEKKK